ncbi:MAG TPA: hypothetical protein EYN66_06080 [Myxococcales bacterium]|jgi:hypothetical protein|nr:hypothetical protein [Myxococcales bacterium]
MDWGLVTLAVVVFHVCLSLFLARMVILSLRLELDELDSQISQAIKAIIEGGLGDFEPPNPIQQAIAELLKTRMLGDGGPEAVQILRGDDGKFSQ